MIDVSGEWSGHIAGTNNANVFVEFTQNGVLVVGSARINDPIHGTAIYTISGSVAGEILQAELHPDMGFFDKSKCQTIKVNGQTVTVKSDPASSHGIVTVNAKLQNSSNLDGGWKSTVGTGGRVFLRKIQSLEAQNQKAENPTVNKTKKVFISYSHKDYAHLERLNVHLKPLVKQGVVDVWDDTKIKVGNDWKREIDVALHQAAIVVLIVSADFLASDFIVDNELPPILVKAQSDGTKIYSVILKPCRFSRDAILSKFQALNPPDKPVHGMSESEQEVIWDRLSELIEAEIGA